MTLLSICQHVARIIPVDVPTVIVGSSEDTASLLFACAQEEGEFLARDHDWTALVKEHTFSTVASTADYSLPTDFNRLVDGTLWNRSDYETLKYSDPQSWQVRKSSILGSGVLNDAFRIRDVSGTVKFSLDPTPTSVETMVVEYVSKNWCKDSGSTGQDLWAADDDEPILDEYLFKLGIKWRVLERLGMGFEAPLREYEMQLRKAKARDGGMPTLSLVKRRGGVLLGPWNVPDTGYGS